MHTCTAEIMCNNNRSSKLQSSMHTNDWDANKAKATGSYNWAKPAMVREHYGSLELLPRHGWAWPGMADDAGDGLERRLCPTGACGRSVLLTVGISSSLAIICILRWRARSRPLTRRCRAAMQRMWSSKINRALSSGRGGGLEAAAVPPGIDVGRCTLTWRHRLSSLSPLTSTSCRKSIHSTNLPQPQPPKLHCKLVRQQLMQQWHVSPYVSLT